MINISCIIINYNTSSYTIACVNSIIENTKDTVSYEIIVVDNASKPENFEVLKSGIDKLKQDNVKIIRSRVNTGFGGGNMLGVQHSSPCRYYAFINNDTLQASDNCLYELMNFMDSTADAAVCSPQMLDENKKFRVTIDHFSSLQREILRRPFLEFINPKKYLNRKKTYETPTKVHYVQGSFLFVNADDFHTIGGFDTNLFLYYEESDLALRFLRKLKKHNYLVPQLHYIHYKSVSIERNLLIKIEQKIALLYHTQKHYGWFQHKILWFYFGIRYFLSSLFKPKYWKLFFVVLSGAPLSKSLKQKQIIHAV